MVIELSLDEFVKANSTLRGIFAEVKNKDLRLRSFEVHHAVIIKVLEARDDYALVYLSSEPGVRRVDREIILPYGSNAGFRIEQE